MNGGSEGVLLPLCWINVINRLFMAGLTLQRLPVCGLQSSCQKTLEYHLWGGGGCLWISGRKMLSLSPRSLPPKEETCPELSLPWAVTSSGLTPWPLLLAGSRFTGDVCLFVPAHIAHLPIDMTSYLLKHSYVCFLGFLWPPATGHPLALPL